MALGQQQGRPVTDIEFTITTLTGEVTALKTLAIAEGAVSALKTLVEAVAVDGNDGDYDITDSSGVAGDDLVVNFNVASGVVTINSITTAGTGYSPDDAVSFDLSGIAGGSTGTMTAAVDTVVVDGTDGDYTITDSSGVAGDDLQISFNVASGAVTINSVVAGGTGYAPDDAVSFDLSGIAGGSTGTVTAAVDTILGEAATTTVTDGGTGWVTGDILSASELSSDGSGTGFAGTVTASALNLDSPETGGVVSAITITAGGTGYVGGDAETLTYIGTGEVGISDRFTYYDHTQYEIGGQIDEYKTGAGLVVTGDAAIITAITVVRGGVNYRVGDRFAVAPDYNGAGAGAIGVVATVDANGAVLTATVEDGGASYDSAEDNNTVFLSRTLNTMATGVYAGSNSDNDPTISVGRLPDQEQLIVQQRDIDGGTITVYAEPTTVNSVGQVVGNVIRAEDITDQYRCVAVKVSDGINPRFKWVTSSTGDAGGASYGYCTERTVAELNADATTKVDADCPAGYVASGTDCVVVAIATINSKEAIWAADHTTDGTTGTNSKQAMEQCLANSGYYEPSAAAGSRCVDASVAGNFSLANFAHGTVSSAQDYAATICRQHGYDWITPTMVCQAKTDPTTLVTQATCAAAGHVWVAGTCYDKADFGDGYSRQGNEGDVNTQPK